jgi:galactose mutarotase-like enzyme
MPFETKTWTVGPSTFEVAPTLGCRLMKWSIQMAEKKRNILYWPENTDPLLIEQIKGGNPILFPFVARTFHKDTEGIWQEPNGSLLPMPRHGFARKGRFKIFEENAQGFSALFSPSEEDKKSYPFNYQFIAKYIFGELSLIAELILENRDQQRIPWCAGHHFYFTLPWHNGLNRSHYQLHLSAKKSFYHDKKGQLIPGEKPNPVTDFDNPILIDRIHTHLKTATCTFGPKNGEENITITVGNDLVPTPWTAITTWTADEKSPFYCIEPWMGPPNAPSHGHGLHWVDPGHTEIFKVTINA